MLRSLLVVRAKIAGKSQARAFAADGGREGAAAAGRAIVEALAGSLGNDRIHAERVRITALQVEEKTDIGRFLVSMDDFRDQR